MRRSGLLAMVASLVLVVGCGTATLLPDGRVLLLNMIAKAYDPATGRVVNLPDPPTPRVYASATGLRDGRVLIAGGADSLQAASGTSGSAVTVLASAELYDPATGRYTATGSMASPRAFHVATLLADGRVLVQGGSPGQPTGTEPSAMMVPPPEIYDPATGTFGPAGGDTLVPLVLATGTLLQDDRVLFAGGQTVALPAPGSSPDPDASEGTPASHAELFDPATGTFAATGSMVMPRIYHTASVLDDGRVLIVGGTVDLDIDDDDAIDPTPQTAEIYDPATGTFTATGSPGAPRFGHAAAVLADGRVLITGGGDTDDATPESFTRSAELYDPASGTFSPTGDMVTGHMFHTATRLPDGRVLLAGFDEAAMSTMSGGATGDLLSSAEIYDPTTGTFAAVEVEPAVLPVSSPGP